jgi:endoglucanase
VGGFFSPPFFNSLPFENLDHSMRSVWIIILLSSINARSQGLKVKGKAIVDAKGNEVILRGMGLGGWMLQEPYMLQLSGAAQNQGNIQEKTTDLIGKEKTAQFYDAWLMNHCTKADIDSLAAWGFNSVRLPMHYNLFTLSTEEEPIKGKNTWVNKGFELTDKLLSWCKANKIYLVLDLHAAPGGQGNDIAISDRDTSKQYLWTSKANQQKTIALWQKLAERYKNEAWMGGYDLINEPNYGFQNTNDKNGCAETGNEPLVQLYKDITAAIRKIDKQHIIYIEGNCWANNYNGIFPLWDDNMVVSFHKYWNTTDKASIQGFLNMRDKYNVPLWMGETGENSNTWFTNAIQLFEENKVGWTWWPLKKIGINNPMQIKSNSNYQAIVDYWKGKGTKPSAETAFRGLMQLAKDSKTSNTIMQRDVIDAMTRQIKTNETLPYKNNIIQNNSILYAVDYDLGKREYAYADKDSGNYWVSNNIRTEWNKGWKYRNDCVDIEPCKDSITNGFSIGWIEDGEWMQYTIYSNNETIYDVNLRTSSKENGTQLSFLLNNEKTTTALPMTGDYGLWQTTTIKNIRLAKGWNKIRLLATKGGFNLNYIQFVDNSNTTRNKTK